MFRIGSVAYVGTVPIKVVGTVRKGITPDLNGVIHLPEKPNATGEVVAYYVQVGKRVQRVHAKHVTGFIRKVG